MSNTPPISPVGGGQHIGHSMSRSASPSSVSSASTNLTILSYVSGNGPSHVPQNASSGTTSSGSVTANPNMGAPTPNTSQSNPSNAIPGNALTSAPRSTAMGLNTRQAAWSISWAQPTWMVAFLIFGILLAVGHHLYYNSLDGSTAGSASRQQWPIRFGTAFAYLTTSSLNAAVGLAFTQQLWRAIRRKSFTIDSIDKMFSITTDPTSFLSWEVLSRAKVVSLLALLVWLIPFAAIVPPATLTVDTVPRAKTQDMAFGTPNWKTVDLWTRGIGNVATVPSDVMLKVAWQTGDRTEILPVQAPAVNSSYDVSFFGPTIRCAAPTDAQKAAFDHYAARILNESNIFVAADTQDTSAGGSALVGLVYSAFSPRFSELVNDPSVDALYNNWKPELGKFNPTNPVRQGVLKDALLQELWVKLADQSIICQLANASYNVHFENYNGAQIVSLNAAESLPEYNNTYLEGSDYDCSIWGNEAYCANLELSSPQMNYIAWFGALSNLLNGNITFSTNSGSSGNYTVTTKLLEQTGLGSCPEIANDYWSQYCQTLDNDKDFCNDAEDNTTLFFPQVEPYFCRNGSLARGIEDLANNITISLLSNQQLPWGATVDDIDSTNKLLSQSVLIPVTITKQVNLYTYDWQSLVISYATAAALVLATVAIGGYAFNQNGVSHVSSFSAIVATTRNPELDALTEGQCLGALPLPSDVGRTRLRFGIFGPSTEKIRHVAFGLEKSVQKLEKGAACT